MPDYSLNGQVTDASGRRSEERLTTLADDCIDQEIAIAERNSTQHRHKLLHGALKQLDWREREIVMQRRLADKPVTLSELSKRYSVSCERVRQIEHRAVEKMRRAIYSTTISARTRNIGRTPYLPGEVSPNARH
jgi:RNA polymerase sigma-32 factor